MLLQYGRRIICVDYQVIFDKSYAFYVTIPSIKVI